MNRKSFAIILMLMVLPCALLFTACGDSSGNGGGSGGSSGDGQWNINFIVDEEVYATVKSSGKEYIKMPANPDKSGCAFIGWYFDKGTWQNQLKANTFQNAEITENVNVFAYFMTDSSNGVKVEVYIDDEKVQTLTTNEAKGYKIDVPERPKDIITDPSISRYFLAWFIDRDCTMKLNEDDTFKSNAKIYAKWIYVYYDEFLYTVEDGKATITKFLNKRCRTDVVIPSQINSIPVEELGDEVLESQTRLKNIIICDGIKRLSDQFLHNEGELINLRLPNTLEKIRFYVQSVDGVDKLNYNYYKKGFYVGNEINPYLLFAQMVDENADSILINTDCRFIGNGAFGNCENLTSIAIPNGVKSIGDRAFSGCTSLTNVTLPSGITSIAGHTFFSCTSLTSIVLPSSVTSIGGTAFYGCSSLTDIVVPSSVTKINYGAFDGCSNLSDVKYAGTINNWCNITFENGMSNPLYYAKNLYINNELVTELVIQNPITQIKNYTFCGCANLTNVIISSSVIIIGNCAFYGCDKLSIYCEATSQPSGWASSWNYSGCPVYWYSETQPTTEGNYWRYDTDGKTPLKW